MRNVGSGNNSLIVREGIQMKEGSNNNSNDNESNRHLRYNSQQHLKVIKESKVNTEESEEDPLKLRILDMGKPGCLSGCMSNRPSLFIIMVLILCFLLSFESFYNNQIFLEDSEMYYLSQGRERRHDFVVGSELVSILDKKQYAEKLLTSSIREGAFRMP